MQHFDTDMDSDETPNKFKTLNCARTIDKSYNRTTIVNYDSRVAVNTKLPM